jgi:predicted transcriptional regulator
MSDKEMVLRTIRRLPADVSVQQIRERVEFIAALKEAENSLDRGEGVSHEAVEKQFDSWVKEWHSKSSGRRKRSKTSTT